MFRPENRTYPVEKQKQTGILVSKTHGNIARWTTLWQGEGKDHEG
ncbi:hypothetical protein HMPREF9997_02395 [Corynebacterium durum F0235]|uniref:Uncharacterized protein n=1 Tax=Corynebacterium durum F0235 TaxID=1035195 RepID=L1M9Y1_9CORY|nr:hypothetical protein HMPREF9997_02395 [Corynebacterium durum F0235]